MSPLIYSGLNSDTCKPKLKNYLNFGHFKTLVMHLVVAHSNLLLDRIPRFVYEWFMAPILETIKKKNLKSFINARISIILLGVR